MVILSEIQANPHYFLSNAYAFNVSIYWGIKNKLHEQGHFNLVLSHVFFSAHRDMLSYALP